MRLTSTWRAVRKALARIRARFTMESQQTVPASHRGNSSRVHLEHFVAQAAASVPEGSLVLDAGAGGAPYASLFADHRYETADFGAVEKRYSADLTYICDLADLPVGDGRYDLVVLTQVLEHLPEPGTVLRELARVLRSGGQLWLSTPLFYEEHETPYDFFRYTQFSLRRLVEGAGLEVERIDWLEGYLGTFGYQLRMAGNHLPTSPAAYGSRRWALAAKIARPVLRVAATRLNRFDQAQPWKSSGMPKNYTLVAAKR